MVFASLRVCKWVCHQTAAFTTLTNNINKNSWTTNENWSCILTNRDDVFERTHKEETQISLSVLTSEIPTQMSIRILRRDLVLIST